METKTIQLSSGRGPRECEWVVAQTLVFLLKSASEQGFDVEVSNKQIGKTEYEIQSVTLDLKGKEVLKFIRPWLGTIQWIGQSPYRKFHKRKNWFIGIFEVKEQKWIEFNENEVEFQSMRSSGAGGQHVNKVSSAVRAIHPPTGLTAVSMESRSQLQNKNAALARLKEKVSLLNEGKRNDSITDQWSNHLELQRGNPVKVFQGERFKQG